MKPQLVPQDVPWMVSPSVSGINTCTWENDHTYVAFNVALRDGVSPRGTVNDLSNPRVVVTFRSGQWVSFSPAHSDSGSLDLQSYDLSRLPLAGVKPGEYRKLLGDLWLREQRCPDPGFYEVESSPWIQQVGGTRYGCHHYIIAGHDARVEVLGTAWEWEYMAEQRPYYNDPIVTP